jgi:hypothetical protein
MEPRVERRRVAPASSLVAGMARAVIPPTAHSATLGDALRQARLEHRAQRLEFVLERLRHRRAVDRVVVDFELELHQVRSHLDAALAAGCALAADRDRAVA